MPGSPTGSQGAPKPCWRPTRYRAPADQDLGDRAWLVVATSACCYRFAGGTSR
jgi:hypothetical protein